MPAATRTLAFVSYICLVSLASSNNNSRADDSVTFDVPSIVHARTILDDASPTEKTIEVTIPLSTEIGLAAREHVDAFRFDVFWNRSAYEVVDYGPRSQTFSDIHGDVLIETNQEENAGGGIHLSGGLKATASGDASVDVGVREAIKTKFSKLPQQEALIASGISHRGTGAFFRFHRSSQTQLEGGRELKISFRVPAQWRAGVLRIDCSAEGQRTIIGDWAEPISISRTFVLPICLANDSEAKSAAKDFARAEQNLRRSWITFQSSQKEPAIPNLPGLFSAALSRPRNKSLPEHWAHLLIQSGTDEYFLRYQNRLPKQLASNAERFVRARKVLLELR